MKTHNVSKTTKKKLENKLLHFAGIATVVSASLFMGVEAIAGPINNLAVTATVAAKCNYKTSNSIIFPTFDATAPVDTDVTVANGIQIQCTKNAKYKVSLGAGSGSGATVPLRVMTGQTDSTQKLQYTLYSDKPGGVIWGDASGGTPNTGVATSSAAFFLPVYGRIFGTQGFDPAADTYQDTVLITVALG